MAIKFEELNIGFFKPVIVDGDNNKVLPGVDFDVGGWVVQHGEETPLPGKFTGHCSKQRLAAWGNDCIFEGVCPFQQAGANGPRCEK